ncbi:MAG TPA: CdaR family protein [Thermoanaerobaculia bacterium]|nr:CdaR family protein [Thermoanaerobaculia bacterium]
MNERARTWGLRLLALGLAIGIWFNASVEDRLELSERLVEASVSYNRPRGFVIMNQIQSVNVRLEGNRRAIRQIVPYEVNLQVDLLNQREPGTFTVNLTADMILLPEGIEVIAIEPNIIRVELEREVTRRIPVIPQLAGSPAGDAKLQEPEVFPNQVLVAGPESLVSGIESLRTRPIRLDGHATTFEVNVPVDPPNPLVQVVQPTQVTVRVPLIPPQPPQPTDADAAQDAADPEQEDNS